MILAQIKIFKEGASVGISDGTGKVWGEYSLVGERFERLFMALFDTVQDIDPIIGDKFTYKISRTKRRKGKK